jgi:hypothetical protein
MGAMPLQEQADDSAIPTAASAWTKKTLDLLNANYESRMVTDFTFNGLVLPDDLQNGITYLMKRVKYSHRPGRRGTRKGQ